MKYLVPMLCAVALTFLASCDKQEKPIMKPVYDNADEMAVIAYFFGNDIETLKTYKLSQLTHIIYSFLRLEGNSLAFDDQQSKDTLKKLVALKAQYPQLKVMVALGGWGRCETCSEVFESEKGRAEFVASTKAIIEEYQLDGLDLDWEYPVVEGFPGHRHVPEDKQSFTLLVKALREGLGKNQLITFAAGGFKQYLTDAIDWPEVMKYVDWVNLMSYDLVNGYSEFTGHHTPLYSRKKREDSTDKAVQFLATQGVDKKKIVIGAAFYARVWENVAAENDGLYQANSKFKESVNYREFNEYFKKYPGFRYHWDKEAKAPYAYNPEAQLFATYDDEQSIWVKTDYVLKKDLRGIMFWHILGDQAKDGLLDAIHNTKTRKKQTQ